jgi:hypothetical protein
VKKVFPPKFIDLLFVEANSVVITFSLIKMVDLVDISVSNRSEWI